MNCHKTIALTILSAGFFAACTQEKPVTPTPSDPVAMTLMAELKSIYSDANTLMMEGKTNDVLTLLCTTLSDAKYTGFEDRFTKALESQHAETQAPPAPQESEDAYQEPDFSAADLDYRRYMLDWMVRLSLQTDSPDDTLARVASIFNAEPGLAMDGVALIYEDLRSKLPPEELLLWLTQLTQLPQLPENALDKAREWEVIAAIEATQDERAINIIATLLGKYTDNPGHLQLAQNTLNILFNRGRLDSVAMLIDTLGKVKGPALGNLLLAARTRYAAASADWKTYSELMKTAFSTLDDSPLMSVIIQTLPLLEKAKQPGLIDALAKALVTTQPQKRRAVSQMLPYWEKDARENNPADFTNRVQIMINAEINSADALDTLSNFFYAMVDTAGPAIIQKLRDQGTLLYDKTVASETPVAPYALIDMAFCLDDFDTVLRYLEAGVPDKDAAWHTMAIIKVKAHRALSKNQNQEAADQFRAFMVYLEKEGKEEDFSDPVLSLTLPKEALLARNAKRIAELLADINPDEAAKARKEAADYYARAVELAKYPEVKALLENEMAQ